MSFGIVRTINHAEIPLFVKRITEEDPAITRARLAWQRWQRELFILDVLSALERNEEAAA